MSEISPANISPHTDAFQGSGTWDFSFKGILSEICFAAHPAVFVFVARPLPVRALHAAQQPRCIIITGDPALLQPLCLTCCWLTWPLNIILQKRLDLPMGMDANLQSSQAALIMHDGRPGAAAQAHPMACGAAGMSLVAPHVPQPVAYRRLNNHRHADVCASADVRDSPPSLPVGDRRVWGDGRCIRCDVP